MVQKPAQWDQDEFCIAKPEKPHTFVMFTNVSCKKCREIKPLFYSMSAKYENVHFAEYDIVDSDRDFILNTTAITKNPILYVPMLILYRDQRPVAVYATDEGNSTNNARNMADFLNYYLKNKSTSSPHRARPPSARNVCYLSLYEAYKSKKK